MPNYPKITAEEIAAFQQLCNQGLSIRDAAAAVGRSSSGMHKYDVRRKPKSEAPKLEQAIIEVSEAAVAEGLPDGPHPTWFFVHNPELEHKVRSLSNSIKRAIDGIKSRMAGLA